MLSDPLGLWMSREDRARLTAVWLNLTSGIARSLTPQDGRRLCSLVIQSQIRGKESAHETFSFAVWTKMSFPVRKGESEGWLKVPSAAFESAQN